MKYKKKRYYRSANRRIGLLPELSWSQRFSRVVRFWALQRNWDIRATAKYFGMPYKTFYAKLSDSRAWSLQEVMEMMELMDVEFGNLSYLKWI